MPQVKAQSRAGLHLIQFVMSQANALVILVHFMWNYCVFPFLAALSYSFKLSLTFYLRACVGVTPWKFYE